MDRRITVKLPKSVVQKVRKDKENAQSKTSQKITFTNHLTDLVEKGLKVSNAN